MSTENSRMPRPEGSTAVKERTAAPGSEADFDDIESFLRKEFQGKDGAPAFSDPLMAELARIVGQQGAAAAPAPVAARPAMPAAGDPFTASPAAKAQEAEVDPLLAFEEELRRFDAQTRVSAQPVEPVPEPAPPPSPVRGYEDFTARRDGDEPATAFPAGPVEPPMYDQQGYAQPQVYGQQQDDAAYPAGYPHAMRTDGAYPAEDEAYGAPVAAEETSRPRNKKVMMLLGGAAALAVIGVVGAVGFRSPTPTSGNAPVIAAKTSPVKERPADPGGVEISGQDRQVLARKTDEPKGPATVVSKEEQPVDLNQTPKREVSRVILAAPTQGGAANPPSAILMPPGAAQPGQEAASQPTAGGFEAKRVRSVKVTGDGEIVPSTAPSPPSRPATPSLASAGAPPLPTSAPAAPPSAPPAAKSDARPTTAARPPQTTTPQRPATPARPAPAAAEPADGNAPLSLRPPSGGTTASAPRTASASPATGGSGGFAVQLVAAGSDAEARSRIQQIRQRHAGALGSYSPSVREATVNGRTVYRVRVAGLSRESANTLCTRLKADGGSCFVAGN